MPDDRMSKQPAIVNADRRVRTLRRIPLTDRTFPEDWLQEILESSPQLLPTKEISGIYSQLTCISREVSVPSGYIDNLYISAQGYIVLVETKLWRNPEAMRSVVAQIIDYAKDISKWDYEKLDNVYRNYHNTEKSIYTVLSEKGYTDEDENDFIDIVTRNLRSARFLLMIAGDGIRESTESMTEFLSRNAGMSFDLALCELEVYDLGNGEHLVVPQLTTKTKIIERTIFRVDEKSYIEEPMVSTAVPERVRKARLNDKYEWAKVTPLKDVTQEDIVDFISAMEDIGYTCRVGTTDISLDLHINNTRMRCLMLFGTGTSGAVQPSSYYEYLDERNYSRAPAKELLEELRSCLSAEQKNDAYERPNGYYFIDMKTFVEKKDVILSAFERFKANF